MVQSKQSPRRGDTRDGSVARAAKGPPGLAGNPWGEAVSFLCRCGEVGHQLQLQWADRMRLRAQEVLAHGQPPVQASNGWDLPLAGMRWGLQEWDQATQDLMLAALTLRGDWMMDHGAARMQAWMKPEASLENYLDFYQQEVERQTQAWAELWHAVGRQRQR